MESVFTTELVDSEAILRETWVLFAHEPVEVAGGVLTCPRCASADEMRLWLHPGQTVVKVDHACRGEHEHPHGPDYYRRWYDPRVTVEYMHEHGETMFDRCER